jgi:hypothetical protein
MKAYLVIKKKKKRLDPPSYMPIISATLEAKIRKIKVPDQPSIKLV